MNDEAKQKLETARTRLILDKPFIGALVLRLPLREADPAWCKTTATDAKSFYYNAEYIECLSAEETQFTLAHEALHCALSHFSRRYHRQKQHWDMACDYAINPILWKEGLQPPPGSLLLKEYEGMTAEEIYPCIAQDDQKDTLDMHLYSEGESSDDQTNKQADPNQDESDDEGNTEQSPEKNQQQGNGGDQPNDQPPDQQNDHSNDAPNQQQEKSNAEQNNASQANNQPTNQSTEQDTTNPNKPDDLAPKPPPLTQDELEQLETQWQQRLAGAAHQAMQAGKMSDALRTMVDHKLQNQVSWRTVLARYLSQLGRDDYNYNRPSTRRGDPAVFPSLRSEMIELVMVLDISASMSDDELNQCASEINALKGYLRARITLHACDDKLVDNGPWIYEPWQAFELPKAMKGRGGTDFRPVFDWIAVADTAPDVLIYFTDAEGTFPNHEPHYPVLWLVKGKQPVPWGQRIQLNA